MLNPHLNHQSEKNLTDLSLDQSYGANSSTEVPSVQTTLLYAKSTETNQCKEQGEYKRCPTRKKAHLFLHIRQYVVTVETKVCGNHGFVFMFLVSLVKGFGNRLKGSSTIFVNLRKTQENTKVVDVGR